MSDVWVEVRTEDRRYYWNAANEEVIWEPPPGVRVVWATERHPDTGKVYYWNKETSESVWSLPQPGRGGTIASSRPRGSTTESWADVRDAPLPDSEGPPRPEPKRSSQVPVQPSSNAAGAELLGSLKLGDGAVRNADSNGHAWWDPSGGYGRDSWLECRQNLVAHATSQWRVRESDADMWQVLPSDLDLSNLLLLETEEPVSCGSLFPHDFCLAGADPEGLVAARQFGAGYILAFVGESPYDAQEALHLLSECWWALTKATSRGTSLVFVTTLGGHDEAADAEEEAAYVQLHRSLLFQSPAPLVIAAQRLGGVGGRQRLLGGWNITESQRDQATEWMNPGSWGWDDSWEPTTGSTSRRKRGGRKNKKGAAGVAEVEQEPAEDWEDEWGDETEELLVNSVTAYLASGPKEVQELAANFAARFNAVVRSDPKSPYNEVKKNDGSFKRWLLSLGFEASALYDRNKCMVSIPPGLKSTKKTGGRAGGGGNNSHSAGDVDDFNPPFGVCSKEAEELRQEVMAALRLNGETDMGSLRKENDLGRRFNEVFFHRSKVNDGSWKRWLASLPGVEVVADPDPKVAANHNNKPTVVRLS
eukprot:TRINITY_DN18745_c0_g1_i1.p1 TRINITY_DN18745_c0_g1~~TRINITY_DN18745_c0_g1_i1.p1  ORF type:complete len:589 (-),score=122.48 TRINITY_DN18745_c0_g1_i1:85-1851(-)